MKRSEMLEKLETALSHHMYTCDVNQETFADSEILSRIILDIIENIGMTPPCRADFGGHGDLNEYNSCKDYVECCDFTWEPENE